MVSRERGVTLVDTVCAFAVLAIALGAAWLGGGGQQQAVARSFRETIATHAAAGRLESLLHSRDVVAGRELFELPAATRAWLPEPDAIQTVRRLAPGLHEVEVAISWQPPGGGRRATTSLTTRIAAANREGR